MFQEYLNVLIEQKYFYLDEDEIKVTKNIILLNFNSTQFVYQCIRQFRDTHVVH